MAKLDLAELKVMVETSADLTAAARAESERDRDYYDNHQWTAEEIATLKKRKQPPVTINRISRKIDAMVGIEQRSRTDPVAYPREPGDEQAADVATKALVFVDDNTRFDTKRSAAFENLLIEGYGGVEVIVEEVPTRQGPRMEVVINRLRWEELFFDPYSREKDFSDATYIGTQKWMSLDAALDLYGETYQGEDDLEDLLMASLSTVADGETYEDRPRGEMMRWGDKRQKRVRIACTYYRRGGVWYMAIYCGGGMIYNEVSPYLDEHNDPSCPIVLMTAYIDRENARYGLVRGMISQQDEINKRRSKLLHQLNSRQTIGVKGAVDSVAAMKRELAAPDGHIEMNIEAFEDALRAGVKPFEMVQNQDQVSGQFSLLQEAKSEIDLVGPNPSLVGQTQGGASGRAIQAQQQAGLAELAPIYDSLRDWTVRVYRAIWCRIQQFWTEERWIRVTDEAKGTEFFGLNQFQGFEVVMGPDGMPMQRPVIANQVSEMDLDIIIQDAPDYVTLRQESFEQLSGMAERGIPIPPEMIIEASSLHNKADLLERLKEEREQAAQGQAQAAQVQQQMMQMQAQIEQMQAEAKARKDMASAVKDAADADKIRAETEGEMADTQKTVVETQRLMLGI